MLKDQTNQWWRDQIDCSWSLYRLGINAYDNSFLSDVIKKLSVNLYRFKHLRMLDTPIDSGTEGLENYIGQC